MSEKYEELMVGEMREVRGCSRGLWLQPQKIQSFTRKGGWRGHFIQRAAFSCHMVTGERTREFRKGVTQVKNYMSLRSQKLTKQCKVSTSAKKLLPSSNSSGLWKFRGNVKNNYILPAVNKNFSLDKYKST